VTTASLTNNCRLWHLNFDDIERPERGGTITMLLKGDEGHGMLDNVTIDLLGRIVMDEDPGNSARVSKIWLYQIGIGEFMQVAAHNPKFFDPTIPSWSRVASSWRCTSIPRSDLPAPGSHRGGRRRLLAPREGGRSSRPARRPPVVFLVP